ncbi:hypothetical protein C4B60_00290 [Jeotgalibacillus proteolyticus]|uniref:Uncharacterized protein n=2 Tax=Jeotgalibacillus proteolyticus TaxID=2082395 RepID=A0A2S5GG58_9BACL|nr:hypothetical protein C4B60_00290 [Jeotgalibacillus proteolyticus]
MNINIEVTKEQYKKILQAFYLGDLVLHSMKETPEETDAEFTAAEQLLFSYAKEAGLDDYIEYDEEFKEYFPTPLMEQEFDQGIRTYEQEILPDQIAALLARNQVEELIKQKKVVQEEALQLLFELEDEFLTRLEQNGLQGLYLK